METVLAFSAPFMRAGREKAYHYITTNREKVQTFGKDFSNSVLKGPVRA